MPGVVSARCAKGTPGEIQDQRSEENVSAKQR